MNLLIYYNKLIENFMKIAFLTAGGIAPCLSACIGRLIYNFSKLNNRTEMIAYSHGFKGLLF